MRWHHVLLRLYPRWLVGALGIGATTAVVAVTDHVLVRPLPFPSASRLVRLYQDQSFRGYSRMELSPPNFGDWRRESRSFSGMAAYSTFSFNLVGKGDPLRLDGVMATSDMFAVLGVSPLLGRSLTSIDDQPSSPLTMVMSYRLWTTAFGGRPDVLGQSVTLNDDSYVVVGVMPPQFSFPSRETPFWVPLRMTGDLMADRANWFLNVIARLADGTTIEQARAELGGIAAQLSRAYPDTDALNGATVIHLRDEVSANGRLLLWALLGAGLCMLLIACTNLAGLFLARALDRQRELSVRAALGADRNRLVRQMLVEHLLIACLGGALGAMLAVVGTPAVARLVPTTLPIAETPAADGRLLAISIGLTIITGFVFGVVPARRLAGSVSIEGLRDGGRVVASHSTERLRGALVCAEVAASLVLLVCAGLLILALWRVQQVDPGFRADGVVTLRTSLPVTRYDTATMREPFYHRVLEAVRALPGVTSAGYISRAPMLWGGGIWPVTVDGQPEDRSSSTTASLRMATPGYFETMRIPLLQGRYLEERDEPSTPRVAVVSQSFVDRHWPGKNPLGRTLTMAFDTYTVAGVVGSVRNRGLERPSEPQVYLASAQMPGDSLVYYSPRDLVVRTSGAQETLLPLIRRAVTAVDPDVPVSDVQPMLNVVADDSAARLVQVRVLGVFAAMALALAAAGLHGLLAFSVASRTREIGVRVALGASRPSIVGLVLSRTVALAGLGVGAGSALALGLAQGLQSLLFGVNPWDGRVYVVAAALCVATALAGSVFPAIRALRVDPLLAMRAE